MEFLKDIYKQMKEHKKWWLLPIIIMLLGIGALILLSGGSALGPFMYTVF